MAGNPNTFQGTLDRALATLMFSGVQGMDITCDFLTPDGITTAPQDAPAVQLETMTGLITSNNLYQRYHITVSLNRAQSFFDSFYEQIQKDCSVGNITVVPDVAGRKELKFFNCVCIGTPTERMNGTQSGGVWVFSGYMPVNGNSY